jgi:hypothetical protein
MPPAVRVPCGVQVPFEEGWVKLRGIPGSTTKAEISEFFKVRRISLGCLCWLPSRVADAGPYMCQAWKHSTPHPG